MTIQKSKALQENKICARKTAQGFHEVWLLVTSGACAMTIKFLDNKICTFKILLSWRFPQKKKNCVLDDFSSLPPRPPPLKTETFTFIVVSPSLRLVHQNCASPFTSDFSLQTWVSQGIPQWESVLSVFIAEKIAVR